MDYKKTGRLIAKKRKAKGLSQGKLSELLGVTPQAVHLWESGQRYPDCSSQIMIYKVLDLNPVELLTGLEMFHDDLKAGIASYMNRIDEKVFVAGNMVDEYGNEFYMDLSDCLVVTNDKNGNPSDKWIPYTDYYNVEPPKEKRVEAPKTPYNHNKIYLNNGPSILVIPVELLEKLGKPLFFYVARNRKRGKLFVAFTDEMNDDTFDIPNKVYDGKWKGIHLHGGEFGPAFCVEMGVRYHIDLLEIVPDVDIENRIISISLDEIKRSTDDVQYTEFLLPQSQYDQLWEDDVEDEEGEEDEDE